MSQIFARSACVALAAILPVASQAQSLNIQDILTHIALAKGDAKNGNSDAAYRRLRYLLANDLGSKKRTEGYLQSLHDLRREKPFTFSASGSITPSSNLTRASGQEYFISGGQVFYLGDPNEDHSGFSFGLSFNGTATKALKPGHEAFVSVSLAPHYVSEEGLSFLRGDLKFGHRYLARGFSLTSSVLLGHSAYEAVAGQDSLDWSSLGLEFAGQKTLRGGDVFTFSLSGADKVSQDSNYHYRDGQTLRLSAGYSTYLTQNATFSVQGSVSKTDLQNDRFSYDAQSLSLRYGRREKSGLSWGLRMGVTARDYWDDFSGLSYARSDFNRQIGLDLSHQKIKIKDMTPKLTCTYSNHGSNVALYDYDSTDCSVSLNYSF